MKYIIAVDQSTSGTKAALLDENLSFVRILRKKHAQYYPKPGWVEHDAEEIWQNTCTLLTELVSDINPASIAGVGFANQRETTVLWDRATGKPVCPAVVWQDVRASSLTSHLAEYKKTVHDKTGLILSPYYSAAKAAAVLDEIPELREKAAQGKLCIGTVDSYLLYRLTGGVSFATDCSNASRTQLFHLKKLAWDEELCRIFGIPEQTLAEHVLPGDADFGVITEPSALAGVPVLAMLGDSHAALFGHGCTEPGMVKASYGTGSSIMMNIGDQPVLSDNGLSTSVGYAKGDRVCYALEGNITCSADTLVWLKDSMQLIADMKELELAETVESADGVYLVPAFSGLGAPWFDEQARAVLCGMNRGTTKAHIIRAALASIAHQNADVMDAMHDLTGVPVSRIKADGGGSVNRLLMQMQSDYVPCRVSVSAEKEVTLYGVARMAAIHAGFIADDPMAEPSLAEYSPVMAEPLRAAERQGWADALRRCR